MRLALLVAMILAPQIALAHAAHGVADGFVSGFAHPFLGPDHLVAMVAVGIWGSQLGMPLLIALPVAFPLMMAVGAMVGVAGVPVPFVEYGISLSAVALGAAVFFALRPAIWAAVAIVAAFALFHGYAHGAEMGPSSNPLAYSLGFVVATGVLHIIGIGIGETAMRLSWGSRLTRAFGAVIAGVGALFAMMAAVSG